MKRIIFKIVTVILITVSISALIGCAVGIYADRYFNEPHFTHTIDGDNKIQISIEIGIGVLVFFELTLMLLGFYVANIYALISTYKGTKKIENNNIIYQRDLADDYNSAVASYIFDGNVEKKQDYKAVLVELEKSGKIYKENGKYRFNNNSSTEEKLLLNQQVVLTQIKNGSINLKEFKNAVIEDTKRLGYVEYNEKMHMYMLIIAFMISGPFFLILFFLFGGGEKAYLYKLTEKGKKEKDKIIKLKSYLTNFSNLDDIESTDNNIWGDYLAYAISLEVNKRLKVKKIDFV